MANPAISSLSFIISALFDLYALVVALRFRTFNLAALLLCFLVLLAKSLILKVLSQPGYVGGYSFGLQTMGFGGIVYYAFVSLINLLFNIFIFSIVILALLSWISPDPNSPIYEILNPIAYPVLGRVRQFVPPLGGLDLSALVAILGLYAAKIFVIGVLVSFAS